MSLPRQPSLPSIESSPPPPPASQPPQPTQPQPPPSSPLLAELAARAVIKRDLQPFVYRFFAHLNLSPGWFHRVLSDTLIQFVDDIAHKRGPRLIIEAPPRHSKSLFTTRGLVPWILANHPDWDMIVANSTQKLADYFGRDIQRVMNDPEYQAAFPASALRKDSNAIDFATTVSNGQYKLVGAGGKLPGFGGRCISAHARVTTRRGPTPIIDVAPGDEVWTPVGFRKVTFSAITGMKPCLRVGFGGRSLVLTSDHRVYTETGWREAGSLRPGDVVYVEDLQALRQALHAEGSISREDTGRSSLLLPPVPQCGKEGTQAVPRMRQVVREVYRRACGWAVLFAGMLRRRREGDREAAHTQEPNLPSVRHRVSSEVPHHPVLLGDVQEPGALATHGKHSEPELPAWEVSGPLHRKLHPLVTESVDGRADVRGLRGRGEPATPPSERIEERRPPGEFGSAMPGVPCKVSYVLKDRAQIVCDITVPGPDSFYAEGLLVHNCLINDDLVGGREMAESETQMDALWNWFNGDMMNRVAPGGGVIVMATRWSLTDLTGRILAADHKKKWKVLSFPAIAEKDEQYRKAGEALQPEWYPLHVLEEERDRLIAVGKERDWLSLFQQRPTNQSGNFFKSSHFVWRDVERIPTPAAEDTHWYLGVDFAASTKSTADCSAVVPIGVNNDGFYYFGPDPLHARISAMELVDKILDKVEKYKPIKLICEKGPLDAVFAPLLKTRMRERKVFVTIEAISRRAEKYVVAAPMQARMEASKVIFPDNQFYRLTLVPQFLNFTPGADGEDGLIDAAANVFSALDKLHAPAPKPPEAKPDPVKEDRDHWATIDKYARGGTSNTSLRRLNGAAY